MLTLVLSLAAQGCGRGAESVTRGGGLCGDPGGWRVQCRGWWRAR